MDSSHGSLPNVDRANSTLFKRYLDEQHKSIMKSSNYQQSSYPINSTIQISHTHRQQQDTYASRISNNNNQSSVAKRKYNNGRRPSGETSKQRTSHTSRFMKRFQRQHKTRDTEMNVQKRDPQPRFEFHDPSNTKENRPNQEPNCTCLGSSNRKDEKNHSHQHLHHQQNCPTKPLQVPRLSLNEPFHSTSQHRQQQIHSTVVPISSPKVPRSPLPMLPPTTNKSPQPESMSNLTYPNEQSLIQSPSIPTTQIANTGSETIFLDSPAVNVPDEYWPIINDLLYEISIEMNDKPNADVLLEIEESLAQRIYNCIVEADDENENENDTISYSTTTNDSSALSTVPLQTLNNIISNESSDLPSSPISTTTRESIENQEKYFQLIHEQPQTTFNNLLERNRHSTPFNRIPQQTLHDIQSPFSQSLLEPVNLLRTVASSTNDDFNFLSSSFSFENSQNMNTNLALFQQYQQSKGDLATTSYPSLPFLDHLLPPRSTPIDKTSSAFKPIEPATTRAKTSFELKRPQPIHNSIGTNWFGQS